jgi:hypothetical protein
LLQTKNYKSAQGQVNKVFGRVQIHINNLQFSSFNVFVSSNNIENEFKREDEVKKGEIPREDEVL